MTGLRLLAAVAGGTLALAGLGAGLLLPDRRAPVPVPPPPPAAPAPASTPATVLEASAAVPDLRAVPAGILARAAHARALDRDRDPGPVPLCRPAPRRDATCAPPRDTVEIQWDVGKDP